MDNLSTRAEKQPEIIEFCGMTYNPHTDHVIDVFDQLIRPTIPITEEITKLNGINNEMVRTAPTFKFLASDIRDLIERSDCVVAHHAAFDRDMVDLEFAKLGQTKIAWPRIICTIEATIHIKGFRLSLSALHEHLFGVAFGGAHRARADVEALARIVLELTKKGMI